MSGVEHFSSMFIGGRREFSKSNSAKMRARGGGRSGRSSGRDSGVGGVRRTPSRWCRYLHTRGRGGRRGRFVADQFGRMFADENNGARGTSRNEILIFLEIQVQLAVRRYRWHGALIEGNGHRVQQASEVSDPLEVGALDGELHRGRDGAVVCDGRDEEARAMALLCTAIAEKSLETAWLVSIAN